MAEVNRKPGDELVDIMPPMPTAIPKATTVAPEGETVADPDLADLESKATPDPAAAAEVDGLAVETAVDAMETLKVAKKVQKRKTKRGESPAISIADQTIEDPERAYRNFMEAIDLVKKHIPGFLKVKVEEIKFQKLAGDIVGKATEDGIIVDPIMLLHPVMRLATVIFHEALHANNAVQNEGLVQAQAEIHFGGVSNLKEYDDAVMKFTKFADIYGNGNIAGAAKEIYKLYYLAAKNNKQNGYMTIYKKFAKRARKKNYFADEGSIRKFFEEVFPELKMV